MSKDNGGPAFPTKYGVESGMTLRDYFAAKIVGGAMTKATVLNYASDEMLLEIAEQCYRMADAMLEARK